MMYYDNLTDDNYDFIFYERYDGSMFYWALAN